MPKKEVPEHNIVFVEELPGIAGGASWTEILIPLTRHPGKWALVREFDTPSQAMNAQSNLHRRMVNIPQPKHEWKFAARGCALYAIYRGPKRKRENYSARIRRTK